MVFRSDINGLRAIAVLGVAIFHFNPAWLPGGFAGVDVFFVISGFLMTGIIFSGIEKRNFRRGDSFKLLSFYKARALRIIPALAAICLVLLFLGWFFFIPLDYKELGKHSVGSVTFISNFLYWKEAGYFDAASHEKWLLHTWSLSVEWQFYIIYPLVLIGLSKVFPIRIVKLCVLIGAILGFIFCVIATYKFSNASYYLLPTRAWQMLFGGVAYLYPLGFISKNSKNYQWFGLLLISISYVLVSGEYPWPGYMALVPVLGAFIVIQSQRVESFITGNFIFQRIGFWSYSIYLWHWVVVVANIKFNFELDFFSYLLITLATGAISFYLFERRNVFYASIMFALVLTFSFMVIHTEGFGSRVDQKYQLDRSDFHGKYYGGAGYPANRFFFLNGHENEHEYVFIGDSYGLQYSKAMDEKGYKVAGLFDHGCLILPSYSRWLNNNEDLGCSAEYGKIKTFLSKSDAPLIMAHSWDGYSRILVQKGEAQALKLSLDEYRYLIKDELDTIVTDNGIGRHYFVLGVPQRSKVNAFECLARTDLLGHRFLNQCDTKQVRAEPEVNTILSEWANRRDNTHYINPNDFLCDEKQCLVIKDREPIHSDSAHLSVFGAPLVVDGIFFEINKIINQ